MFGPRTRSKRARRLIEREERKSRAMSRRLVKIAALAKAIENDEQLTAVLEQIPDDQVRAATRSLIEPFLMYRIQRVELTDAPLTLVHPEPAPGGGLILLAES